VSLKPNNTISCFKAGKKSAILLLLAFSAMGAFATLGDGKYGKSKTVSSAAHKNTSRTGGISLRSGYTFRGTEVINTQAPQYINLNSSVATYQQGNKTYVVPVKTRVLSKVVFNPNEATRSYR
jgi:hypothetical protein